jgi:hypothetical protein
MIKVRQHIPTFFTGFEPAEAEVDSLRDLLALEFVQRWLENPIFYRLSIDHQYMPGVDLLMAETNQGDKWYVVAYLRGDISPLQVLPDWTGKRL